MTYRVGDYVRVGSGLYYVQAVYRDTVYLDAGASRIAVPAASCRPA